MPSAECLRPNHPPLLRGASWHAGCDTPSTGPLATRALRGSRQQQPKGIAMSAIGSVMSMIGSLASSPAKRAEGAGRIGFRRAHEVQV